MEQSRVYVRTLPEAGTAVGWSGRRTLTIDRPVAAGGAGLGYSGGELLLLAVGACYCNNLFSAAHERGIPIARVEIEVTGDWDGEPIVLQRVALSASVEADASQAEIQELMAHASQVSAVGNSLGRGVPVTLVSVQAVPAPKGSR
jgi:uncharacterized OsmC-like protein